MIKIKRNNEELIVTKGAFEEIFKPLGYEKVEDKKQKMSYEIPKEVEKPNESKIEKQVEEHVENEDKKLKK